MLLSRLVTPQLFVMLHDKSAPCEQEWALVLGLLDSNKLASIRAIAITDGGAPTREQQQQLKRVLKGQVAQLR